MTTHWALLANWFVNLNYCPVVELHKSPWLVDCDVMLKPFLDESKWRLRVLRQPWNQSLASWLKNAGLDPIDELLRITAAQTENDSDWQGLDVNTGRASDMGEAAVTEPLTVTRHAIAGATEAAISVLRIDDVLWAKQDAQEPDWQTDED